MRYTLQAILIGLLATACASSSHNYAAAFASVVNPEAPRLPLGAQGVILVQGTQMVYCQANEKHLTECHLIGDWTPQQPHQAQPAPAPAPAAVATSTTGADAKAEPAKSDALPKKPETSDKKDSKATAPPPKK